MAASTIKKSVLAITTVCFLYLTGCSKGTKETYDQLKMGMDYNNVIAVLGKADKCDGAIGLKTCVWGNDKKYIQINFAGEKVVEFYGQGFKKGSPAYSFHPAPGKVYAVIIHNYDGPEISPISVLRFIPRHCEVL